MIKIKLMNDSYCVIIDDTVVKEFSTRLDNAHGLAINYVNKLRR